MKTIVTFFATLLFAAGLSAQSVVFGAGGVGVPGFTFIPNDTGFSTAAGVTNPKTVTFSNTMTFTGVDGNTYGFPSVSATLAATNRANNFSAVQSFAIGDLLTLTINEPVTATALASAATIAPVRALFHISGAVPIVTITPPTNMSTTVGGCLDIIFDVAETTTAAGNIFAAYTFTAGQLTRACYDGTKWYIK